MEQEDIAPVVFSWRVGLFYIEFSLTMHWCQNISLRHDYPTASNNSINQSLF